MARIRIGMVLGAALAAGLSGAARGEAPGIAFDGGGVDVKGLVAGLRETAKSEKVATQEVQAKYRAERDCAVFAFEPAGPEVSEAVWLRSTEYREECHWAGDPRQGGHRVCHEVPAWTHRERVQIELRGRKELRPWERESFEVCLEGRWLNLYGVSVGHKYATERRGGSYTLTAGERVPMNPDRHGIAAEAPRNTGSNLAVDFADRWASYYPGEQVALKVALKREVEGWFDPSLVEKELSFPTAERYTVDFTAFAAEFSQALKPGKKYYVEWGFRRVGAVSKPTQMKVGDSPAAVFQPSAGLFVLR